MPKQVRRWVTAAALVPLALMVSACGGDDDKPTTSQAAGATEATQAASGEPIKIMTLSVVAPGLNAEEIGLSVEARAKAVNAAGGIGGRPLEVEVCNTKLDPNVTVQCARKAVSEDVTAVVGGLTFFPQVFPILEKAGIPFIGGLGISPEELNSPISYPVGAGEPGWFYGEAKLLADKGVQNPAFITCEPASCQWAAEVFEEGWNAIGSGKIGKKIVIPDGQADMAPIAASATAKGIDGIALATYDSVNAQLVKEIRQTGFEGPIVINATNISPETIKALGPMAKGLYAAGNQLPTSSDDPAVKQYREELEAQKPGTKLTELGTNAWAATDLFVRVAEKLDQVDAETLKQALDSTNEPIETGIAPPWQTPTDPPLEKFSRLQRVWAAISEAQPDGSLKQETDGFTDVAK